MTRRRSTPRTCGRSCARSRPGRGTRGLSRRGRRGSSRTTCRRSRAPAWRARSRRSRSRSARTPTSRGTGGCSARSEGRSRGARAARASAPSSAPRHRRRSARRGRAAGSRRGRLQRSPRALPAATAPSPAWETGSTRNAPATITSSETERFAHSRKPSKPPSSRSLEGTGSIPHGDASIQHSLPSPA